MKTVTINRNSWHYKLARHFDIDGWNENICAYLSSLSFGVFICVIAAYLIGCTLYAFGDFIAWAVACLVAGMWIDLGIASGLFAFFLSLFILISAAYYSIKGIKDTELVLAAYESIHDKVCFRLNIE